MRATGRAKYEERRHSRYVEPSKAVPGRKWRGRKTSVLTADLSRGKKKRESQRSVFRDTQNEMRGGETNFLDSQNNKKWEEKGSMGKRQRESRADLRGRRRGGGNEKIKSLGLQLLEQKIGGGKLKSGRTISGTESLPLQLKGSRKIASGAGNGRPGLLHSTRGIILPNHENVVPGH